MRRTATFLLPIAIGAVVLAALPPGRGGPKPRISAEDVTVVEGDNAVVTLMLSEPAADYIFVEYRTASRSADAGDDFVGTESFTLFFPGDDQAVISVPTFADGLAEGAELFTIRIRSAGATAPGGPIRVTIVDN